MFASIYHLIRSLLTALVGLPQVTSACRFTPTCSVYVRTAFKKHGIIRGSLLSFKRVLRCHPFTKPTYDPVP